MACRTTIKKLSRVSNIRFALCVLSAACLCFAAAQGNDNCNAQFFWTVHSCDGLAFGLRCNTCYEANFYVKTISHTFNDKSIYVDCQPTFQTVRGWKDNECTELDYASNVSTSCNECFPMNPLLVAFKIQGKEIWYHGFGHQKDQKSSSSSSSSAVAAVFKKSVNKNFLEKKKPTEI